VRGGDALPVNAAQIAREIAATMESAGCDYAIGGAIALGYWAEPRGTLDVDVTLFLPPKDVAECVGLLKSVGCELDARKAADSLTEHGFCQVQFHGGRLDVFLPTIPFYDEARRRRRRVELGDRSVLVWDAETLCVFKLMFFRLKDLADVEQILRVQGASLDRDWVTDQILRIYGVRDPRIARWRELTDAVRL
jgi:hypothetical protein